MMRKNNTHLAAIHKACLVIMQAEKAGIITKDNSHFLRCDLADITETLCCK